MTRFGDYDGPSSTKREFAFPFLSLFYLQVRARESLAFTFSCSDIGYVLLTRLVVMVEKHAVVCQCYTNTSQLKIKTLYAVYLSGMYVLGGHFLFLLFISFFERLRWIFPFSFVHF